MAGRWGRSGGWILIAELMGVRETSVMALRQPQAIGGAVRGGLFLEPIEQGSYTESCACFASRFITCSMHHVRGHLIELLETRR